MVESMTGYGREICKIGNSTITIEVKSVNHRFLDCSINLPASFLFLEDKIKKIIHAYFERGRISVFLTQSGEDFMKKSIRVNWDMMDQYVAYLKEIKQRYALKDAITLPLITANSDCIQVEEISDGTSHWEEALLKGIDKVCKTLQEVRRKEGHFLLNDMFQYIDEMEGILQELQKRRPKVIEAYGKRIRERIQQFMEGKSPVEEERLFQEIAILAEKGDITEEITRLYSHIEHFKRVVEESNAVGRKLDFITQEMLREVNTIGSKSMDHKISEWSIQLKSIIEKVKEQVQNIE